MDLAYKKWSPESFDDAGLLSSDIVWSELKANKTPSCPTYEQESKKAPSLKKKKNHHEHQGEGPAPDRETLRSSLNRLELFSPTLRGGDDVAVS